MSQTNTLRHEDVAAQDRLTELCSDPDILWGADQIAEVLNIKPGRAAYLLDRGRIPAARRIGGLWAVSKREMLRTFIIGAEAVE